MPGSRGFYETSRRPSATRVATGHHAPRLRAASAHRQRPTRPAAATRLCAASAARRNGAAAPQTTATPAPLPPETKFGVFAGDVNDLAARPAAPPSAPPAAQPAQPDPNTERVKAQAGVGIKGRSLDQYEGVVVTPVKAFFAGKERAFFDIEFPGNYRVWRQQEDRAPKDFDELKARVPRSARPDRPSAQASARPQVRLGRREGGIASRAAQAAVAARQLPISMEFSCRQSRRKFQITSTKNKSAQTNRNSNSDDPKRSLRRSQSLDHSDFRHCL